MENVQKEADRGDGLYTDLIDGAMLGRYKKYKAFRLLDGEDGKEFQTRERMSKRAL